MTTTIQHLCQLLAAVAPLRLAESWDNVGLLVGDRSAPCQRVMTCLTISPPIVAEAIAKQVDLIVTHHPLPFKPLAKLTADTIPSSMVLDLIANRVSVYSAHTAFDSAAIGINQQLAEGLALTEVAPLLPEESVENPSSGNGSIVGSGRYGRVKDATLQQIGAAIGSFLELSTIRCVGDLQASVSKVALACGSGGSFLDAARRKGCNGMITGEATFHTCLEAQSSGIGLVLVGHYASERFAMQWLAERIASEIPELVVWASCDESDPIQQISV